MSTSTPLLDEHAAAEALYRWGSIGHVTKTMDPDAPSRMIFRVGYIHTLRQGVYRFNVRGTGASWAEAFAATGQPPLNWIDNPTQSQSTPSRLTTITYTTTGTPSSVDLVLVQLFPDLVVRAGAIMLLCDMLRNAMLVPGSLDAEALRGTRLHNLYLESAQPKGAQQP